jgi:hypothetical protein
VNKAGVPLPLDRGSAYWTGAPHTGGGNLGGSWLLREVGDGSVLGPPGDEGAGDQLAALD